MNQRTLTKITFNTVAHSEILTVSSAANKPEGERAGQFGAGSHHLTIDLSAQESLLYLACRSSQSITGTATIHGERVSPLLSLNVFTLTFICGLESHRNRQHQSTRKKIHFIIY